jgi:hypothetical protein
MNRSRAYLVAASPLLMSAAIVLAGTDVSNAQSPPPYSNDMKLTRYEHRQPAPQLPHIIMRPPWPERPGSKKWQKGWENIERANQRRSAERERRELSL